MDRRSFLNDPEHWRERAEEARTRADQIGDPKSKNAMLRIANDYELLAERAEARASGCSAKSKWPTAVEGVSIGRLDDPHVNVQPRGVSHPPSEDPGPCFSRREAAGHAGDRTCQRGLTESASVTLMTLVASANECSVAARAHGCCGPLVRQALFDALRLRARRARTDVSHSPRRVSADSARWPTGIPSLGSCKKERCRLKQEDQAMFIAMTASA
jgi:hypothetical protein